MTSSPLKVLVRAALAAAVLLFTHAAAAQTLYYIHADHLNTPRLLTDQNQAVVWRWDQTEPFGNSVGVGSMGRDGFVVTVPLRYPGQYFDKETNLHYNYFRDYDPAIGRYATQSGSDQRNLLINKTKSENSGHLGALEACFWWQKRSFKDQLQRYARCLDACF